MKEPAATADHSHVACEVFSLPGGQARWSRTAPTGAAFGCAKARYAVCSINHVALDGIELDDEVGGTRVAFGEWSVGRGVGVFFVCQLLERR
jgi:hypothetical protein